MILSFFAGCLTELTHVSCFVTTTLRRNCLWECQFSNRENMNISRLTPANKSVLIAGAGQPLDQNPAAVYLASLESPQSRRTMRAALDEIAYLICCDRKPFAIRWVNFRSQHVVAIRSTLAETYAAPTVNKMLSALRGVLRAASDLGQMNGEEFSRAIGIEGIKSETLPRGRALPPDEIGVLLDTCCSDLTPAGARDAALIALLSGCGVRRAEVAALDVDDYDANSATLSILGRRNTGRSVPVPLRACEALADWIGVRGGEAGALFRPIAKGGKIERRHMTAQAIYDALIKRARRAGISHLSPHDFRRTFVSNLLDAGTEISTVQMLAGHANVTTTARYDHCGARQHDGM